MKSLMFRCSVLVTCLVSSLLASCQSPVAETGAVKPATLLTLKSVPAGTYLRDGTSGNTTTVSAFQMAETEVTREQYLTVTGQTDPSSTVYSTGSTDPVQMVSWYQILVFCNKLSLREGLTPVYSIGGSTDPGTWGTVPTATSNTWDSVSADWNANGYRLPTEAEWMWAAMGGQGTFDQPFAGSSGTNTAEDYAWTNANASGKSHPVKTKLPNGLGLYDMSGNVWERVWDWYEAVPAAGAYSDRRGPSTGTERTIRGGAWYETNAATLKVSARNKIAPGTPDAVIGFRVVRGSGHYAVPVKYTLTFDGNGADSGIAPAAVQGESGASVVLPANPYGRSGYGFAGWEVWRAGALAAETTAAAGSTVVFGTANVTVKASWVLVQGPAILGPIVKAK